MYTCVTLRPDPGTAPPHPTALAADVLRADRCRVILPPKMLGGESRDYAPTGKPVDPSNMGSKSEVPGVSV